MIYEVRGGLGQVIGFVFPLTPARICKAMTARGLESGAFENFADAVEWVRENAFRAGLAAMGPGRALRTLR